jgi:uncharacterized protein
MIKRNLSKSITSSLKNKKSVLLLGPRQTGKSTLCESLPFDHEFNLSDQGMYLEFIRDPNFLLNHLRAKKFEKGVVFIDEVQRVPSLLNTVQYIVDKNKNIQFILTGSSARKLKKGHANLLPGRVHSYKLGPIVASELEYTIPTDFVLSLGSLPEVIYKRDDVNSKKLLKSYAHTYLHEEIKAEALTKDIEGFSRFIFNIAAESASILDLTKISKLSAVPRQTVQRYFEILEDTLLIHKNLAFAKSEKKRLVQHPKFYFFDNGVLNSLLSNFVASNDRKGMLFENLVFVQLINSLNYSEKEYRLSHYRTDAGSEVDIVLELGREIIGIEIKSGAYKKTDLNGLTGFENFIGKKIRKVLLTPEGRETMIDDVEVMDWQSFLKDLKI